MPIRVQASQILFVQHVQLSIMQLHTFRASIYQDHKQHLHTIPINLCHKLKKKVFKNKR